MREKYLTWKLRTPIGACLLAAAAMAGEPATAPAAVEQPDRRGATLVYNLVPSTNGNPEGIAYDEATQSFFVGTIGNGTIYRGTLDNPAVTVFIAGAPDKQATGMKVSRGKLYVAGGFAGTLTVYDIASKQQVASFQNFGAGMLNDLVVMKNGDVIVTDSIEPKLWRIAASQVDAGGGVPEGMPMYPEIEYEYDPDPFNLNGIVAVRGDQSLIVVQSNTGRLFRIDLDRSAPLGRRIVPIAVEPLVGGDGLLFDGADLAVVQGGPPGVVSFVRLNGRLDGGSVVERRTSEALRFPSTVAAARQYYLVVNFDILENQTPFTVVALPRNFGTAGQ